MAGDCYIAACGILSADDSGFYSVNGSHNPRLSAQKVMAFARAMMTVSEQVCSTLMGGRIAAIVPVVFYVGVQQLS